VRNTADRPAGQQREPHRLERGDRRLAGARGAAAARGLDEHAAGRRDPVAGDGRHGALAQVASRVEHALVGERVVGAGGALACGGALLDPRGGAPPGGGVAGRHRVARGGRGPAGGRRGGVHA
jgi:hypothetical protein